MRSGAEAIEPVPPASVFMNGQLLLTGEGSLYPLSEPCYSSRILQDRMRHIDISIDLWYNDLIIRPDCIDIKESRVDSGAFPGKS